MIDRKELDFMRLLVEDTHSRFYTDAYIEANLDLTKVFHYIFAQKLILGELKVFGTSKELNKILKGIKERLDKPYQKEADHVDS